MRQGVFRDGHPHIELTLPGRSHLLNIQFIVDTGFDGDLALPDTLARQIDATYTGVRNRLLADGSVGLCDSYEMQWSYDGEEGRIIQILVLDGRPLIGTQLLIDNSLHIEVMEGGEVYIEAL